MRHTLSAAAILAATNVPAPSIPEALTPEDTAQSVAMRRGEMRRRPAPLKRERRENRYAIAPVPRPEKWQRLWRPPRS